MLVVYVRSDIPMGVNIKITVFRDVKPCSLAQIYQCIVSIFREAIV